MTKPNQKPIDWSKIDPYLARKPQARGIPKTIIAKKKKADVKRICDATRLQIYWIHWHSGHTLTRKDIAILFRVSPWTVSQITNDRVRWEEKLWNK
jgi:hypothetical protein